MNERNRRASVGLDGQVSRRGVFLFLSYALVFAVGFMAQLESSRCGIETSHVDRAVGITEKCEQSREYGNGWHSIEVFYGKTDYFEQKNPVKEWASQANQDIIVSRMLKGKSNGYFLDLAANHAVELSNTYSLEKKFNWTGLCMEPNAVYWSGLSHRSCQVVAAVVGETRMEEVLFQGLPPGIGLGAFGGIVGDRFDNHDAEGAEVKYTVPLSEILHRFNAPKEIDYLSLDVEGAEMLIMQHFPFDMYTFNIMTVERPDHQLQQLFNKHGYEYVGSISFW